MELKEFVKSTTQAIIDATKELISENEGTGSLINPKLTSPGPDADFVAFYDGFLPVTSIDFDVAVTEESEKSGATGGKLKIAVVEFGADGRAISSNSSVSRIQFKLRLTLPGVDGPGSDQRYRDFAFKVP